MAKVLPQIVRHFDITIHSPWKLSTHWFVKQYYSCTIERRSVQESTYDIHVIKSASDETMQENPSANEMLSDERATATTG